METNRNSRDSSPIISRPSAISSTRRLTCALGVIALIAAPACGGGSVGEDSGSGMDIASPAGCRSDSECADSIDCTTDTCVIASGSCIHRPTSALCAAGENCNPMTGCEPDMPLPCPTGCPPFDDHTLGTCRDGVCGYECAEGWADCDLEIALTGCETDLTRPESCGSCEVSCPVLDNTSPTCALGECGFECVAGWQDCNGDAVDGCEIDLSHSAANCGACGNECPFPDPPRAHTSGLCVDGACDIGCDEGWGDCNADSTDGCETDLMISSMDCGSCGNRCGTAIARYGCQMGLCCNFVGQSCGFVGSYPCCDGAACRGAPSRVCGAVPSCSPAGPACDAASDCCSNICNDGRCCGRIGDSCSSESDCCLVNNTCYGGRCCVYSGAACGTNSDCCSGICSLGRCRGS